MNRAEDAPGTQDRRRFTAGRVIALVVVLLAMLATATIIGLFGIGDLGGALNFNARITGALLIAAAAVIVIGAGAAVVRWSRPRASGPGFLAFVGACTALLANAMLLVVAIRDRDGSGPFLIIWSALTAASAYAAYLVSREGITPVPYAQQLGITVAVSAAIGVGNFAYTQLYMPYTQSTGLTFDAGFGPTAYDARNKVITIPVNATIANHGNVDVYLVYGGYVVDGSPETVTRTGSTAHWRTDTLKRGTASRYTRDTGFEAIQRETLVPFYRWINAGQTLTISAHVDIPATAPYQDFRLTATLLTARRDRMLIDPETSVSYSWRDRRNPLFRRCLGDCVVYRARFHENNSISEHTRAPRYVTVWQFLDGDAPIVATIGRRGHENDAPSGREVHELTARYGWITYGSGTRDVSLAEITRGGPPHPSPTPS